MRMSALWVSTGTGMLALRVTEAAPLASSRNASFRFVSQRTFSGELLIRFPSEPRLHGVARERDADAGREHKQAARREHRDRARRRCRARAPFDAACVLLECSARDPRSVDRA